MSAPVFNTTAIHLESPEKEFETWLGKVDPTHATMPRAQKSALKMAFLCGLLVGARQAQQVALPALHALHMTLSQQVQTIMKREAAQDDDAAPGGPDVQTHAN